MRRSAGSIPKSGYFGWRPRYVFYLFMLTNTLMKYTTSSLSLVVFFALVLIVKRM